MATDKELSKENPALLQHILKDPLTKYWESTIHKPYVLNEVPEYSAEYITIDSLFSATSRGRSINRIERVENPYLLGHYILKREKMSSKCMTECLYFHGTGSSYVDAICQFNFDWRKCGNSTGHRFGQGVSFAPEVSYAAHYAPDDVMILAKVLKGYGTIGNQNTDVPPEPYDTTHNGKGTVYVKYEDDDFYPQYVIHF